MQKQKRGQGKFGGEGLPDSGSGRLGRSRFRLDEKRKMDDFAAVSDTGTYKGAYETALNHMSNSQPSLLETAKEHLNAGRPDEARKLLMKRAEYGPPDCSPMAWHLLAIAEAELGRYQASIEILSFLCRHWPRNTEIYATLQQVLATKSAQTSPFFERRLFSARAHHMNYPSTVCVETTSRCNANCVFCPHNSLDRRNTEMKDSLFMKVIEDLKEIPLHIHFSLAPFFVDEPFMDKRLFERLEIVNKHLTNADIFFNTNFNFIPKKFFESIKRVKNIIGFRVSLLSHKKQEYEAGMNLDFDRTIKNLRELMHFNRRERVINSPIFLTRIGTLDQRDEEYLQGCAKLFDGFEQGKDFVAAVFKPTNWLGDININPGNVPFNRPCGFWFKLVVMSNGVVPFCCMDSDAKYPLGNVNQQSLLSIYNSALFRSIRETARTRETIFPCNQCTAEALF